MSLIIPMILMMKRQLLENVIRFVNSKQYKSGLTFELLRCLLLFETKNMNKNHLPTKYDETYFLAQS